MDNNTGFGKANFFQMESSAWLEINLGTGFRFIGELNYRSFYQSDLFGLSGHVG
jgi:hypothetical protein